MVDSPGRERASRIKRSELEESTRQVNKRETNRLSSEYKTLDRAQKVVSQDLDTQKRMLAVSMGKALSPRSSSVSPNRGSHVTRNGLSGTRMTATTSSSGPQRPHMCYAYHQQQQQPNNGGHVIGHPGQMKGSKIKKSGSFKLTSVCSKEYKPSDDDILITKLRRTPVKSLRGVGEDNMSDTLLRGDDMRHEAKSSNGAGVGGAGRKPLWAPKRPSVSVKDYRERLAEQITANKYKDSEGND